MGELASSWTLSQGTPRIGRPRELVGETPQGLGSACNIDLNDFSSSLGELILPVLSLFFSPPSDTESHLSSNFKGRLGEVLDQDCC